MPPRYVFLCHWTRPTPAESKRSLTMRSVYDAPPRDGVPRADLLPAPMVVTPVHARSPGQEQVPEDTRVMIYPNSTPEAPREWQAPEFRAPAYVSDSVNSGR